MELLLLSLAMTCPQGPGATADATRVRAQVEVQVSGGVANATINYKFTPSEAHLDHEELVESSYDAVVVGALLRVGEKTWRGSSIQPESAASEFDDYRQSLSYGVEPDDQRAFLAPEPAIRLTERYGTTKLSVASPCAYGEVEVTVTVRLASTWDKGEWVFQLPGPEDATVLSDRGDVDRANGTLRVRPSRARLRGRFHELELDNIEHDKALRISRAELDVPEQLSHLSSPLAMAFVVDRSVSAGDKLVARQIELMNDILDKAPRGSVYTAVSFARHPKVLVSPWTSATSRAAAAPALENGSDLGRAVKKALAILEDAPKHMTPRLVVLSDMKTVERRPMSVLTEDSPLTHAVELKDDPRAFDRTFVDEDDEVSDVEVTGGIWVTTGIERDEALALHLIRPTRIDRPMLLVRDRNLFIDADATLDGENATELPAFLVEGASVRMMAHHRGSDERTAQPRALGYVWASPIAVSLDSSEAFAKVTNARMTAGELATRLDDVELRALAERSEAVTRATPHELVPEWRMARQDSGGLGVVGVSSCGCGGSSHAHGIGCHGIRTGRQELKGREFLAAWIASAACPSAEKGDHVVVEVGDREIMETGGSDACRAERFWSLRLDQVEMSDALRAEFSQRRRYIIELDSLP